MFIESIRYCFFLPPPAASAENVPGAELSHRPTALAVPSHLPGRVDKGEKLPEVNAPGEKGQNQQLPSLVWFFFEVPRVAVGARDGCWGSVTAARSLPCQLGEGPRGSAPSLLR